LGLTPQAAAGITANLQAESGLDPHAQNGSHYGIAQWDKHRQQDFADWAGFDIKDQRADFGKQLQFVLYELFHGKEMNAGDMLLNADTASRAGYVVSHYYERSGLDVQDNLRSAAAQRLSSETTINVHGVTDPGATAKIIANEQERVNRINAELIREFSSSGQ
jgi:Phage tail lysozyme